MDGSIAKGLGTAFLVLAVIAFILGGIPGYLIGKHGKNTITAHKRIEPEIRLTIVDNKVDTLFIYKRP